MALKKLALIPAVVAASLCAVPAQEARCTLKLADLPPVQELRGFRPGMTVEEVRRRLPTARIRAADGFGYTSLNIFPDYETGIDKASLAGVRTVSLEFLDGRVSTLWIGYDRTFKWQTLDEFSSAMTNALGLPDLWRTKLRTRLMDCADFTVAIIPVGDSPSIKIIDEQARELLETRKEAKSLKRP